MCRKEGMDYPLVAPEPHLAVTTKDHGVFKGADWRTKELGLVGEKDTV